VFGSKKALRTASASLSVKKSGEVGNMPFFVGCGIRPRRIAYMSCTFDILHSLQIVEIGTVSA